MADARRMPPRARSARKELLGALDFFIDGGGTLKDTKQDHMKVMRLVERYVDARLAEKPRLLCYTKPRGSDG